MNVACTSLLGCDLAQFQYVKLSLRKTSSKAKDLIFMSYGEYCNFRWSCLPHLWSFHLSRLQRSTLILLHLLPHHRFFREASSSRPAVFAQLIFSVVLLFFFHALLSAQASLCSDHPEICSPDYYPPPEWPTFSCRSRKPSRLLRLYSSKVKKLCKLLCTAGYVLQASSDWYHLLTRPQLSSLSYLR